MSAGRFAPSPTNDLHLGNLRTALLAWLFAQHFSLDFLLRIEDLDTARVRAARGAEQRQLADLRALGITWAEPVWRQSERLEIYREAARGLDTYECFCTRREIAQASSAPHGDYRPYPGTCARLSEAQKMVRRRERPGAIRVRAHQATMEVHDLHAGVVTGLVDDFVLFRADGTPAYNLATVVDDGLSQVSQVCRGVDLLDSAPRQAWLAEQLGFPAPNYAHVGLAVNREGKRLAKRDRGATLTELRAAGHTPAEVVALLARSADLPECGSAAGLWSALAGSCWHEEPAIWQPWLVS